MSSIAHILVLDQLFPIFPNLPLLSKLEVLYIEYNSAPSCTYKFSFLIIITKSPVLLTKGNLGNWERTDLSQCLNSHYKNECSTRAESSTYLIYLFQGISVPGNFPIPCIANIYNTDCLQPSGSI